MEAVSYMEISDKERVGKLWKEVAQMRTKVSGILAL